MFLPGEVSRKWEVCGQNMEESWKSAESIVGMQYVHQENTLQSLRCRVLPYIGTHPGQWNSGLLSLNAVHSYGKMHKFCPCYENIFIGTMFGKTEYGIRCFAQKVFFFFSGGFTGKDWVLCYRKSGHFLSHRKRHNFLTIMTILAAIFQTKCVWKYCHFSSIMWEVMGCFLGF